MAGQYVLFCELLAVYSVGLLVSKPAARKLAALMRWPLRHTASYKRMTKYSAPLVGIPLIVGFWGRSMGWHWWFSGLALVFLSVVFHGELVRGPALAIIQRCDQTVAAYHFAYHLWLALCVGSMLGIVLLGCVVLFYWSAWIEAYTHVGVHVCAALAGLVILLGHAQSAVNVSAVPFVLM